MRTKNRIIICVAGIFLLTTVMGMCGCGKGKSDSGIKAGTYQYTPLQLENMNEYIDVIASCFNNESLYYLSVDYEKLENEIDAEKKAEWTDTGEVRQYNCKTGDESMLIKVENASDVDAMNVDDNNLVSVVRNQTLIKYSADGSEIFRKSLFKDVEEDMDADAGFDTGFHIGLCRFERDGALYISEFGSNTNIYKFDSEGNNVGVIKYEEFADDFLIDNQGNFVVITGNGSGLKATELDFETGKKKETVTIENQKDLYYFGNGDNHGGSRIKCAYDGYGDVSYFLRDSAGLFSYNKGTEEIEPVFEWLDTGIIGEYVRNIEPLSDGRLFCICKDPLMNFECGFVEKLENPKEKTVIKCAALYPDGDYAHDLQKCIVDFNRKSDDVYVEYISYEKSESPISAFAKDIIAGNIPDVMDISSVDVNNYISKGLFEDLVPYMEKDDVLNKDYFVDGLLDAVAIDGKQYFAFRGFILRTLAGKASDLMKYGESWTMTDMIEYYKQKPEGTHLYMYDSKEDVYDMFVSDCINDFIDWETGKVSYDSDEFRQVLEFCKMFPDDTDYGIDYNEVKKSISEGSTLLDIVSLRSPWNHEYKLNESFFEGDAKYIGFPSKDDKLAYIEPAKGSLAISSASEHKDEAWEFLKAVITVGDSADEMFPAGKKDFEKIVKKLTTTEIYKDEDGKYVEPLDGVGGWNNLDVVIKPYSEEDIQIIKKLITKSKPVTNNHEISDMIKMELTDYFADRKSIDETIAIIQDRVGKYVNENR